MKYFSHSKISYSDLQRQVKIFKALASPFRLAIVLLLAKEELPVNEIVSRVQGLVTPRNLDRTNVCKNLSLLRKLGLLSCCKKQQMRIYSLQAPCLVRAISCTLELKA